MKKFLAMLLALVMALSLVACGKTENPPTGDDGNKDADPTAKVKVGFITLLEKAKDGIEGKTGTRVHQ